MGAKGWWAKDQVMKDHGANVASNSDSMTQLLNAAQNKHLFSAALQGIQLYDQHSYHRPK